jgi:hypothetical protein
MKADTCSAQSGLAIRADRVYYLYATPVYGPVVMPNMLLSCQYSDSQYSEDSLDSFRCAAFCRLYSPDIRLNSRVAVSGEYRT